MLSGPLSNAELDLQLWRTGKILAGVHGSYVCSASLKNHILGILGWNTQREAVTYVFENLALCAFHIENFYSGLSTKKKKILQSVLQYPIRCLVFREVEGKKVMGYNRILGPLILLEMHVEKITLMNLTGQCIYLVKSILKMDLIDNPITILKRMRNIWNQTFLLNY